MQICVAVTNEEKEAVYRSRYAASPDGSEPRRPPLVEPEDENSWLIYGLSTDGEIAGSARVTRGSDGFSLRQVECFELEPLLAELPPRVLAVVERVVVAPSRHSRELTRALFEGAGEIPGWDGVLVVVGACSRLLLAGGLPAGWTYRANTASNPAQMDLAQVVSFPHGPGALAGLGHDPGLPRFLDNVLRTPAEHGRKERLGARRHE